LSDEGKELMTNILQPQIAENFTKQPSSGPAFAAMTAQAHPYATANAARVNELKRIDVPVTLAWGKRDPYLTTDLAKVLAAQFKSASLDFVDAGHWPQIELPHETAALILRASQDG
jgi:haloalkane dehalogenase